jgi:hypothetical protein
MHPTPHTLITRPYPSASLAYSKSSPQRLQRSFEQNYVFIFHLRLLTRRSDGQVPAIRYDALGNATESKVSVTQSAGVHRGARPP